MKKLYSVYLLVALLFFSACSKENDPSPGTGDQGKLTSSPWVLDDAIVHLKYNFDLGLFDLDMDTATTIDTTYSLYAGYDPCMKDLKFNFTPAHKVDLTAGSTYCGAAIPKDAYSWQEKENFGRLLIIGKDAGGIVYTSDRPTTISDTLNLEVKELSATALTGVYNVPLAQVYEQAGMDAEMIALLKTMGFNFTGNMEITYKWKKK